MSKIGKPRATIYGVGVNDSSLPTRLIKDEYARWMHVMNNCFGSIARRREEKSTLDPRWYSFSAFIEWLHAQPNWREYELHKSIKEAGNVLYSPDTCVMVHPAIRRALRRRPKVYDGMPHGVTLSSREAKRGFKSYVAQGRSLLTGKALHLGVFRTPEEAHAAWQEDKIEHLKECLTLSNNDDVTDRLNRDIARLRDDRDNKRITIW
jgi:hypothetical protein